MSKTRKKSDTYWRVKGTKQEGRKWNGNNSKTQKEEIRHEHWRRKRIKVGENGSVRTIRLQQEG